MIKPRDVDTMDGAVHMVNGMIDGADNVVPGEAGGIGNKGLEALVYAAFPKAALRSSATEWKTWRKKVKALDRSTRKAVAAVRRRELSCVYAERARQARITNIKLAKDDAERLQIELDAERTKSASLARQLEELRACCGL
jgi:hypothetical protein